MFKRLIRSPIAFFDLNPIGRSLLVFLGSITSCVHLHVKTGRILNRFTKDVAIMDDNLPLNMFDFIQVSGYFHVK